MNRFLSRLRLFLYLIRIDRPIGTFLLLWPCWWGLWLAADGPPSIKNLVIFSLGTLLMRSAGCAINDYADRNIDPHVARTRERPLASRSISAREALGVGVVLAIMAFALVSMTNTLTIALSVVAVLLTCTYPFLKRHTHLPQVVLGAAFSWSIPMAFAAQTGKLPPTLWLLYCAAVVWTIVYDTFYAMVDREDDLKLGMKSTAILFGDADRFITGLMQILVLWLLFLSGRQFHLGTAYFISLIVGGAFFVYQQWLIRRRERERCFQAFLNNNFFGLVIFAGIAIHYAIA